MSSAKDLEQRQLYDDCEGFIYVHGTVGDKDGERRLPKGAARKKALQYLFVEPQPPQARTIPSLKGKGATAEYGDHLFQFFTGKVGLGSVKKNSGWGKIVWELTENVAEELYTDKKLRGKGVRELIKAFNNFESHETWCIDSEAGDDGFGVQLVIVWDGEIPPPQPQKNVLPKVPAKIKVTRARMNQ